MEKNNYTSIRIEENKIFPIIKEEEKYISIVPLDFNSEILDLKYFSELKSLHLFESLIKKIIIPKNNQLEQIVIIDNSELEDFDLENLSHEIVLKIYIIGNPKLKLNLEDFSKFVNLNYLQITDSNCDGSLFSLRNLINLSDLRIYNTQIIPSYEYLNNETIISFPFNEDFMEKNNLNNKFLININKKINNDYKFSLKIKDFKKTNSKLFKNAEFVIEYDFLKEFPSYLDECFYFLNQASLAFYVLKKKRIKDQNYNNSLFEKINSSLNKNKLLINAIFNPSQSFNYWLEEKIITIDKLKKENEEFCRILIEQ
ncbi:MAG: hypothetical protein AM1032_000109 [Mycoplasmataceae bacterium]|nr:MAG: hypothetical protein AM1032_000109 [Mycoplasmataceae bacterium]